MRSKLRKRVREAGAGQPARVGTEAEVEAEGEATEAEGEATEVEEGATEAEEEATEGEEEAKEAEEADGKTGAGPMATIIAKMTMGEAGLTVRTEVGITTVRTKAEEVRSTATAKAKAVAKERAGSEAAATVAAEKENSMSARARTMTGGGVMGVVVRAGTGAIGEEEAGGGRTTSRTGVVGGEARRVVAGGETTTIGTSGGTVETRIGRPCLDKEMDFGQTPY